MTGINLSQSHNISDSSINRKNSADRSFLIAVVILVITILVFGGMKLATQSYNSKKIAIESQIEASKEDFFDKEIERVADFQQRINNINSNFSSKSSPSETLNDVARAMVTGSITTSIGFKEGGVSVAFMVDNYQIVSKQILGLKKAGFSQIKISKMERNSDGKVLFSVDMKK